MREHVNSKCVNSEHILVPRLYKKIISQIYMKQG